MILRFMFLLAFFTSSPFIVPAFGDEQFMFLLSTQLDICWFLEYQIYEGPEDPNTVPNIATIAFGNAIKNARLRLWDRDVGDDSNDEVVAPCMEVGKGMMETIRKMVNPVKYVEKCIERLTQKLYKCINNLARKSVDGNTIHIRINYFSPLILTTLKYGRELIGAITFYPEFDLDKAFYIELLNSFLTPMATRDTLVEDIMLGTKAKGYWNKKIFEPMFNEEYFTELKYKSGSKPYWQFMMVFPKKFSIIHFCQWSKHLGYGQKFRLRYNLEDETGFNWLKEQFNNYLNPPDPEICF